MAFFHIKVPARALVCPIYLVHATRVPLPEAIVHVQTIGYRKRVEALCSDLRPQHVSFHPDQHIAL